jgi:hypothetical protein
MVDIKNLVYAPISIEFDIDSQNSTVFRREFDLLEQSEDDPVGHWIKIAKAKGDSKDTDKLLLELIMELHRKIDQLSQEVLGKAKKYTPLARSEDIDSISYEYFKLKNSSFVVDKIYYGRITMPTFPRREIPVYFKSVEEDLAQIKLLHDRDRVDWDTYVAARDRSAIREAKREKFEWE